MIQSFKSNYRLSGCVIPLLLATAAADDYSPAWWSTGTPAVINPTATPNNAGPATIGQAKWMAFRALATIDTINAALGTQIRSDLTGPGKAVPNWDAPVTADQIEKQKAPLTIGQLKALAAPFYARINAISPDWLAAQRRANNTDTQDGFYPWTASSTDDANGAIATIGQLKAVFALDFTETGSGDDIIPNFNDTVNGTPIANPHLGDVNNDGLFDDWAVANNVTSNGEADDDGDGYTNKQEQQAGTNPKDASSFPPSLIAVGVWLDATASSSGSGGGLTQTIYTQPWDSFEVSSSTASGDVSIASAIALRDGLTLPGTVTQALAASDPLRVNKIPLPTSGVFAGAFSSFSDNSGSGGGSWANLTKVRMWLHLPPADFQQTGSVLSITQTGYGSSATYTGQVVTATVPANSSESQPMDFVAPVSSTTSSTQSLVTLPSAETIYTLSGKTEDHVVLAPAVYIQGTEVATQIPCQWTLKNPTPVIGSFDRADVIGCTFTPTTPGQNVIQLKIGGSVVWEKTVKVLNVVKRAEWVALPSKPGLTTMPSINAITIHNAGSHVADGAAGVRSIQYNHMYVREKTFSDIGYHYLIDRNGVIFEGRTLETGNGNYWQGSHVADRNPVAGIGVCLMADYDGDGGTAIETFSPDRVTAAEGFMAALARRYNVTGDRFSYHQQMATKDNGTDCPGPQVINKFPTMVQDVRNLLR